MKKLSFSIDKYELEEINNSQFAKLRLYVCHDLDNKNGSYISLDSMKMAEDTLWNKPIIMKLNKFGTDFEEHEPDVIPVGFIPKEGSNIHYEEISGRNYLVVDAIIWKYYSSATLEIFERDNTKGISMEIQVFEEHKREEDNFIQLDSYAYLAVCLLGSRYETGMYRTTAQVVEFSKEKTLDILDKEWSTFINHNDKDKKISSSERLNSRKSNTNKVNRQFIQEVKTAQKDINNISEETVSHIKMQYEELKLSQDNFSILGFSKSEYMEIENFMKEVQEMAVNDNKKTEEEVDEKDKMAKEIPDDKDLKNADKDASKEEMAKTDDAEAKEDPKEEKKETSEEEAKEDDKEKMSADDEEDMSCGKDKMAKSDEEEKFDDEDFKAKYADLFAKFEALQAQMAEKDTALLSLNSELMSANEAKDKFSKELDTLQTYKADIEKIEKAEKLKDTFSILTNVLSKEEIDEWKVKSEQYQDVKVFETDIKAFACDKLLKSKNVTSAKQFSSMAVNLDATDELESTEDNLWTRITKRVSK